MDIQYLLWLQELRNNTSDALTPFMEWVSTFAVDYLILFAVFYYWNRDKRGGLYTLTSYYFCMVLTPLIKLTACVYRPWIRDSRILPAGDSITTATIPERAHDHGGADRGRNSGKHLEERKASPAFRSFRIVHTAAHVFEELSRRAYAAGCLRGMPSFPIEPVWYVEAFCVSGRASGKGKHAAACRAFILLRGIVLHHGEIVSDGL